MRYMLLIHWDEKAAAARDFKDEDGVVAEHGKFIEGLVQAGKMRDGMRLRPETEAARVTVRDGKRLVTDGPFAETKEVVGGFYVIECDSMQEAIEWAAKCPSAKHGTIEVRPEWPTS